MDTTDTTNQTNTVANDEKLQELQNKVSEMETNWKRAIADYKNLEKRIIEERMEMMAFASTQILTGFLGVLDNLEMVAKHSNDQGLKLTVKDFKTTMEKYGVKELEADAKEFDAKTMEAIEVIEGEKNKVIEVLNKGYLFNEKLLRPARVKVGNGEKLNKEEK